MTTRTLPAVPAPASISPELLKQHSLTAEEYARIEAALGRTPSLTELGIYSVMWSEHCSYKSSRVHLRRLPTRGERTTGPGSVVQGPGENAGIIDIGDGWACAFKIESHNHPSYIEPFQGATTGVGGILRDIFTMGARPLAVMDSLRFGPLSYRGRRTRPRSRPQEPPDRRRCRRRRGQLWQLLRRTQPRRRNALRALLQRQPAGQRLRARAGPQGRDLLRQGHRRRQSGDLRRRQDRPRRHPRRHHGQRRVHRRLRPEAPQRADGRSLHGEAAARGVPRSDADRRGRRHSGYGRCRPDLLHLRDGRARRRRPRRRARQRAAARDRHVQLRDHALGKPGAHAARRRKRPRERSAPRLREVGTWTA